MTNKIVHLTAEQHAEVLRLKEQNGLMEYEAIMVVLSTKNDNFITRSVGTASQPQPGLIVEFI